MINRQTSVGIVGGGAAALLLGLWLAHRGVDVLVLEGHETVEREFRGEVLQPHSLLTEGLVRLNAKNIGRFDFTTIVPEYPYAIWMPNRSSCGPWPRKRH